LLLLAGLLIVNYDLFFRKNNCLIGDYVVSIFIVYYLGC